MADTKIGPYPNRLGDIMRSRDINDPQLAELVNTTKQQINKLRRGERQLTALWARRLAPALQTDWKDLLDLPLEGGQANVPIQAARLAALRRATWGEAETAAAQLGVTLEKLRAQEDGSEPLDVAFVMRVLTAARTSPSWVYDGNWDDLSPRVAARLAVVAPELVEELEAPRSERPPERAAGAGETKP